MLAAEKGHTAVAAVLLHAGASVTATNERGHTAAETAVEYEHTPIVELIAATRPLTDDLASALDVAFPCVNMNDEPVIVSAALGLSSSGAAAASSPNGAAVEGDLPSLWGAVASMPRGLFRAVSFLPSFAPGDTGAVAQPVTGPVLPRAPAVDPAATRPSRMSHMTASDADGPRGESALFADPVSPSSPSLPPDPPPRRAAARAASETAPEPPALAPSPAEPEPAPAAPAPPFFSADMSERVLAFRADVSAVPMEASESAERARLGPLPPTSECDRALASLARELFICYCREAPLDQPLDPVHFPAANEGASNQAQAAVNAFPRWCLHPAYLRAHPTFAARTLTFYEGGAELSTVRRLLVEREPTNVAMYRKHEVARFAHLAGSVCAPPAGAPGADGATQPAGWSESFYMTYWREQRVLAPNIAVYCETPALEYDYNNDEDEYPSSHPPLTLRVLNVMGYGFDDDRQPDAERFGMYSGESAALYAAMRSIFVKILAWCVPCNPRTALAMTVVPYHCLSYRRAINQINLCLG